MKIKFSNFIKNILHTLMKYIYWGLGYTLWILLFISITIEMVNGGSIFRSLLHFQFTIPDFINLEALGKVSETIGISSILIAWLYSSLDKVELGLKYIDILKEKHKYFYVYTLSHILSILISIWASKSCALEVGVLALCIVLWGCIIHGIFLWQLLFNSNARRMLSSNIWERNILKNSDVEFFKTVYSLTDIVDIKENFDTETACELIGLAMYKIPDQCDQEINKNLLYYYSSIWKNLLDKHCIEKRNIISNFIFKSLLDNKYMDSKPKVYACAGYILWLYNYTLDVQESDNKEQATLIDMQMNLNYLNLDGKERFEEISDYLYMFYYALMWLVFFDKKINLNSLLLDKSNEFCYSKKFEISYMKKCINVFADCLQIYDKGKVDICCMQLFR